MLSQEPVGIDILGVEIGPITIAVLGTMVFVISIIFLRLIGSFFFKKGRDLGLFRGGSSKLYNKYFYFIVFGVFFMLSFITVASSVPFDDPFFMIIASMFVILFIGWSFTSDIRILQILVIALLGSFIGYFIANIMI